MNEPQEAQPIPRFTSQKSWDGLSHRMVEFESGEYVRYADFHKAEAALAEAQEKLRNATGTIQRLEQEQVHMAAPALAEAALAEAQQERDEARDQLIALGFFEACQSCDHNHGWHEGECDHRSENGSPCGCEEFKPNDVQKLDRAQQRIRELEQALRGMLEGGDFIPLSHAQHEMAAIKAKVAEQVATIERLRVALKRLANEASGFSGNKDYDAETWLAEYQRVFELAEVNQQAQQRIRELEQALAKLQL